MKKLLLVVGGVLAIALVFAGCAAPAASTSANTASSTSASTTPATGSPVSSPGQGSGGLVTVMPAGSSGAPSSVIGASYQPVYSVQGQPQNTGIWVTGSGQVSAAPDIAVISLGVQAQSLTVAEAQASAASAMNAVVQALESKGVAQKDISTESFSITPTMDYKSNTITGYQVSNIVTAKVRNVSDTGAIIDAAASAGGNLTRINSVSFGVDDPTPLLTQARAQAMADAAAKAGQLATLAGVKLGLPTYISETTASYAPRDVAYAAAGSIGPSAATPINPGQTEVTVNVQVVYSIQ